MVRGNQSIDDKCWQWAGGERGGPYNKVMSKILKMIFSRFKVFQSTILIINFFRNSFFLYFNNYFYIYTYIFSSATPFLSHFSNALNWHFSHSYKFFLGEGAGVEKGLLNIFLSCQHVLNYKLSMEKHSFSWVMNANLKVYFLLVNKWRRFRIMSNIVHHL